MADGVTFKVEPRHVQMFGAQGILAPLYQRQATKLALAEKERESQAQYEQLKALTQMRAQVEAQLQEPYWKAQIERLGAETEYERARTGELTRQSGIADKYAAPMADAAMKRDWETYNRLGRAMIAESGGFTPSMLPQEGQAGEQIFTMVPQYNEQGVFTGLKQVAGHGYFAPAGYFQPQQGALPNIPMTWKDCQAVEDQVNQGISGFVRDQNINSPVLGELGIRAKGTVGNFVKKYMGGLWDQAKMDEVNAVLSYIADPKNERTVASDKQIQTIANAMRTLQPAYDTMWREQFLGPAGVTSTGQPQAGGGTGFQFWGQAQGGAAPVEPIGGGPPTAQPIPVGQQLVPSGVSFPTPEQYAQYRALQQLQAGMAAEKETEEQAELRRKGEELRRRMAVLRYYQLAGKKLPSGWNTIR